MSVELEEEIKQLVLSVVRIPPEKLTTEADFFTDLGVDSLKAIEVVAEFEKKYRIVVKEEDVVQMRSIRKIVDFLKRAKEK